MLEVDSYSFTCSHVELKFLKMWILALGGFAKSTCRSCSAPNFTNSNPSRCVLAKQWLFYIYFMINGFSIFILCVVSVVKTVARKHCEEMSDISKFWISILSCNFSRHASMEFPASVASHARYSMRSWAQTLQFVLFALTFSLVLPLQCTARYYALQCESTCSKSTLGWTGETYFSKQMRIFGQFLLFEKQRVSFIKQYLSDNCPKIRI